MNEQEWLACTDPQRMLEFLPSKISDRKLRLCAVACCRLAWHLMTDEMSRKAVEIGEQYADGAANDQEREMAYRLAKEAFYPIAAAAGWFRPTHGTTAAALFVVDEHASDAVGPALGAIATVEANVGDIDPFLMSGDDPATKAISDRMLLLEIIGNPFRPTSIDSTWLTQPVLSLAQAAYDKRNLPSGTLDNACLAVLADALEDAGCDSADILNHCRQYGDHYRGCWVVDLLLRLT